jgi:hypothetical protein
MALHPGKLKRLADSLAKLSERIDAFYLTRGRKDAAFDESEHPRASNGQFGSGGGGAKTQELGPKDVKSIESYTLAGSYPINDFLRNGTAVESGKYNNATHLRTGEDVSSAIHDLDATFAKAALPESMTVHRGLNKEAWQKIKAQASKDGIIEDKGFASTAKSKKNVTSSSLTHWLTITVPKGYPAIDLDSTGSRNRTAGEILLDRGTKFRVVKMTGNNAVLEVIPKDG